MWVCARRTAQTLHHLRRRTHIIRIVWTFANRDGQRKSTEKLCPVQYALAYRKERNCSALSRTWVRFRLRQRSFYLRLSPSLSNSHIRTLSFLFKRDLVHLYVRITHKLRRIYRGAVIRRSMYSYLNVMDPSKKLTVYVFSRYPFPYSKYQPNLSKLYDWIMENRWIFGVQNIHWMFRR